MRRTINPAAGGLSDAFRHFAAVECRGSSPLYEHLASSIAGDEEVLALAECGAPGQPAPNLLFAAVQFLLLQGGSDPLARYYPSLGGSAAPPAAAYPAFRAFCLDHSTRIAQLLGSRRVQTNEVGRCSYLLLGMSFVDRLAPGCPLAVIEIGASAGLNLLWDRYGYRYGQFGPFGERTSLVQLGCDLRGGKLPPWPVRWPQVVYRVGIDLQPIDVSDPEQALWLRALIWPEHKDRAATLAHAIEIARVDPPCLTAGDAMVRLPDALADAPRDAAVCVFHTHTLNQLAPAARTELSRQLDGLAATRD